MGFWICYYDYMKKNKLIQFNKNALKAVAIATAVGTIGGYIISNQIKQTKQKVEDDKQELIQNQTYQKTIQDMTITSNASNQTETNDIFKMYPMLTIVYLTDGKINIKVNHEYLSLEDAIKKYPVVTGVLIKYINPAYINPEQMTIQVITEKTPVPEPENNLER